MLKGDRSPRTFYGKIISTTLCILGMAFWTLPGGIIGSGFAFKIEEKNKKNQLNRLLPAAATLIQSWWRMKATLNIYSSPSSASCLIATVSTFNISKPIYSSSLRRLKKHLDQNNGMMSDEANHYFSGLDPRPPPQPMMNHRRSLSESQVDTANHANVDFLVNATLSTNAPNDIHHDEGHSAFVTVESNIFYSFLKA
jgi:hypothetical protein